ncbi:ATP-dependent Clp protease ATP-binding subunit ClpX [Bifidobacterium vansinderenii]|uniref:ATP-dependent Clp protease ATP-binding subunit ClpX n=1 Tax=Bifidobacterium vansinderenii TaxID=1984871 RepID=A0A229VVE4_9BIFI|nr:ATP-dependent Clp protease ATP-binding subunit ClpX [Bifidobacterium vansinderenii]OXM99594.1 ATP-dependent Clp protease, ATP-binding subunit ClpX [Bifidobacterium vansinderenii]
MGRVVSYSEDTPRCTFCGKSEHQVHKLVTGPGAAICDECIELCVDIISDERRDDAETNALRLPYPRQIFEYLDRYVVGQKETKRTLSVAVYNHYKRVNMSLREKAEALSARRNHARNPFADVEVAKSNILLLGPTGVGKTYLAQTLARVMNVPFIIADATTLTEAGYVGDDVETILQRLIQAADGDVERASKGIIYIDEIDKIARKSGENTSITRDVSGEGVQQALLKIIEGTVANVPMEGTRKHKDLETVRIDTNDILFICGGAFVGLKDIIEQRLGKYESGFNSAWRQTPVPDSEILHQVSADDLTEFGLLPEFIGRLPVVSVLDDLTEQDLEQILQYPANALVKQYQKLFSIDGVRLSFTDKALSAIAHTSVLRGTGARGLRSIIEKTLEDIMFQLPELHDVDEVIVDERSVLEHAMPRIVTRDNTIRRQA